MAVSFAQLPQVGRKLRQPEHAWAVKHLPFAIQPFMIAPVLPGETLKNALMQVRAVTQPVKPSGRWTIEDCPVSITSRTVCPRPPARRAPE